MPVYDSKLLQKIGMDVEFTTVWKAVRLQEIDPIWKDGSCLLTIQFLCSLKEVENEIIFWLFE
jgi:hypothetical protein